MTRAERFAKLSAMLKAHPMTTCHIFNCAACAHYYAVLLARDESD